MSTPDDTMPALPGSRRDLLRSVGRWTALVVLVGGVGDLVARTTCRQTPCGACPLGARCDLPKARLARDDRTKQGDAS